MPVPRCKYRYYVTLLPCKQFHLGGHRGTTALSGGPPGHPLEPPLRRPIVSNRIVAR